ARAIEATRRLVLQEHGRHDAGRSSSWRLQMSLARFASFAAATAVALTMVVTSTVRPADAGLTKALKCSFDKQRAAVRRAEALLDCRREALRANALIDAACVDRAMERFDAIFQK